MMQRLFLGLVLVTLAAVLLLTGVRTLRHANRDTRAGQTLIRFAHTQLEPGLREAFTAVAEDYMALHPDVRVEQMAVPRRIWPQWIETRLIGDDPPDLLQIVNNDANLAFRHFRPLDAWMEEPNPYNAGTELEPTPWRNTFITPLTEPPAYWPRFLHYYGAPLTVFTSRIYCNLDLLREITGGEEPPRNYREFVTLCRQIRAWDEQHGRGVFPLAGARPVPPNDWLFTQLLRSQTQRLMLEQIDRSASLGGGGGAGGDFLAMAREAYFRRVWSLRDPEIQSGLRLVREVGQFFQPGFLGAERDDALFYFLQGRAVMIASGSWDYLSIVSQVPFEVGAFPVPMPEPDDPLYGRFSLGSVSEAQNPMRGAFALSKRSRQPDAAIDFLRYLTSVTAHRKFSALSHWVPVVRTVETSEELRPLAPRLTGYPGGFNLTVGVESTRLWENHINLLFRPAEGIEAFNRMLEPRMDRAVLADEAKESRDTLTVIAHYDARAAADLGLREAGAGELFPPARRSELLEAQADLEMVTARLRYLHQTFDAR